MSTKRGNQECYIKDKKMEEKTMNLKLLQHPECYKKHKPGILLLLNNKYRTGNPRYLE